MENGKEYITLRSIYAFLILLQLAAIPAFGAPRERTFEATSFVYSRNATPQMSSRKYKSRISFFKKNAIEIIKIKNFFTKKKKFDNMVKIIRSEDNVGNIMYNEKMEQIGEYPVGKVLGSGFYSFVENDKNRNLVGNWYIKENTIMSDFTITDKEGTLLFKETVIYRAK